MTLQSSGAIKFSEIQTEFGGSNPISLSEYYAGGAYVPGSTSGVNGAVPASGSVAMSKYLGTSNFVFTGISDDTVYDGGTLSASSSYGFNSNYITKKGANSSQWCNLASRVGDYEVRVTTQSGVTPAGSTLGTWLAMSTARSWSVSASTSFSAVTKSSTVLVEIRLASTGVVVDSAYITLTAEAYGIE